jgi:hypothetical protein
VYVYYYDLSEHTALCASYIIPISTLPHLSFSYSSSSETDSENEDREENIDAVAESVVSSTINDEDLPPEITASRPSWLYRRSRTPTPPPGEKRRYIIIHAPQVTAFNASTYQYSIVKVLDDLFMVTR